MLSYRHAFHAGNHADVLKHFVEVQLLRHLAQKDKPLWYIDTHAGAGCYALDSGYATQNAEYGSGIARLWQRDDLPAPLAEYVGLVKAYASIAAILSIGALTLQLTNAGLLFTSLLWLPSCMTTILRWAEFPPGWLSWLVN